ncbi:putative Fe(2+)-trafficking protein [invertebrate metagenome]|uniref:Putative Fe(2+)-trafficking protein n=1 Tax=invertebrate metagenome TaxID=1711999 RepID=A0A2H9T600_9ZZZZ
MNRIVHCVKLEKEAEGLSVPPLPGEKGQWLFEHVSQEAWNEWQQHQTRLINEKRLNLLDPQVRQYLMKQMDNFLSGEDVDQAEGYTPDSDK